MFLFLFFVTGVGNASTFQMIPAIMRKEMDRLMPTADAGDRACASPTRRAAAIIGFTSAIAAYGAFFIPKSYGTLDRADRRAAGRAVRLPRLLPLLHRHHLVVLHAAAAACSATSSAAAADPSPVASRQPAE